MRPGVPPSLPPRSVPGTDGFRIILTLELHVDLNQEVRVWLQAMQCPGPGAASPRRACLAAGPRRPDSTGGAR